MSLKPYTSLLNVQSPVELSGLPPKLLQFLNNLPVSGDTVEWIKAFRDELKRFLGNIDHVSININNAYDRFQGDPKGRMTEILHHVTRRSKVEVSVEIDEFQNYVRVRPQKILEVMRSRGFPLSEYQEPYCCNYYDHSYLGTMFLFRYKGAPPIPPSVIQTVEALRPFMFFVLSSAVTRNGYIHPGHLAFADIVVMQLDDEVLGLSNLERQILLLRLMGCKMAEIADKTSISIPNVKKQLRSVRKKTGARSGIELITRILAPDLEQMVEADIAATEGDEAALGKRGLPEWLNEYAQPLRNQDNTHHPQAPTGLT